MKEFSYETLSSRVAEFIRKRIIFSEYYKSGDHISESEIAKELDISRAPVREAFRELENQGLITSVPRKGNFVTEFTDEDIEEIFDIRVLLENRVFESIIKKGSLTKKDWKLLTEVVDQMVEEAKKADKEEIIEFNELDMKFHSYLWRKSGRKWTTKMLSNLHYQLQLAMVNDLKVEEDLEAAAKIHYKIIDSLQNGDLDKSKELLLEHIISYQGESI